MYKLLLSHPFTASHGTQLQYKIWKKRLDEAELKSEKYLPKPSPQKKSKSEDDMDIDNNDAGNADQVSEDDSDIDHEELNNSMLEQERSLPEQSVLIKAKLTVQYYQEAIEFFEAVQKPTAITCQLLFSKNRKSYT